MRRSPGPLRLLAGAAVACAGAAPPGSFLAQPFDPEAAALVIRRDAARRAIVLEVQDEGVGIPPEHLPRLTDPFFTTKRESGGTGLGLSVSAGIVKEHGGTLEFRSSPGAGTAAILKLPEAHEEAAA